MRQSLRAILLSIAAAVIFASCDKGEDGSSIDEELAEYTIIAYGCGGGNLDDDIDITFREVEAMGYQESIQFTAMYKYSISWQEKDEEYEGVRLFTMESSGEMSNTRVGDADLRLDEPQTIADFIIDAKRRLPAKKYILILNNHGGGFDIRDQPTSTSSYVTKVICSDDHCNYESISIFELEDALEIVGERFDMLYWDACLMNTIENNYQIYEYFDYIMGSSHPTYGTNYSILIDSFLKYDNIVESGKYYTTKIVEMWREIDVDTACDLALLDCSKIESVVDLIGDACDILCEYRDSIEEGSVSDYEYKYINGDPSEIAEEYYFSTKYNEENPLFFYTEGGVHYFFAEEFNLIDLCRSLRCISSITYNSELSTTVTLLNDAVDEMFLSRESLNLPDYLNNVSISVSWMSDVSYNYTYPAESGYELRSMSELYPLLDFDRATGWGSRFLSGNVVQAVGGDPQNRVYYNIER